MTTIRREANSSVMAGEIDWFNRRTAAEAALRRQRERASRIQYNIKEWESGESAARKTGSSATTENGQEKNIPRERKEKNSITPRTWAHYLVLKLG